MAKPIGPGSRPGQVRRRLRKDERIRKQTERSKKRRQKKATGGVMPVAKPN